MSVETKIIRECAEWKRYCAALKSEGGLGFVPTMGALHEGHASLLSRAAAENRSAVASVFVNPTQFNDKNDLAAYPRVEEADIELLSRERIKAVFMPSYEGMYPDAYRYKVVETPFSALYCGAHRPGHFDGVLTVVLKLLLLANPDKAYFGEKDYQQYMLVRDCARAFFMDARIVPCPIVREPNGLAMSSRNERLSRADREAAGFFYREISDSDSAAEAKARLSARGVEVEYVEDLDDVERGQRRRIAAIRYGGVRLIDNVALPASPEGGKGGKT